MQIELIAFDADDTLWHNEIHYRRGWNVFNRILAKHGVPDPDEARLHEIEIANLEYYGYGAVGFAISMVEAAMEMTAGQIAPDDLQALLAVSKTIISADVELFAGVKETIQMLAGSHPLMLVTKGNELHQASKIERSGLRRYFDHIEIVPSKTPETYTGILDRINVSPDRFIMVGNAMRSDILPVLEIGGCAVYIHNELTWSHENDVLDEHPPERFFEVHRFDELHELIRSIAQTD